MTTLICNFQDIVGERINGHATLSAGEVRIGQDSTTVVLRTPSPPEPVVEGEATFEYVEPGPAILQLHWNGQSATLRFTVPNTPETILLSECVEQVLEYTPPIVNRGLDLIENARDEALGQVEGAVDEAIDTRLDAKADVSTVNDLAAVTTGFMGVARRNARRIRELVSELATKADTATVDGLSALVVSALGVGRRNTDRIRRLAADLTTKADKADVDDLSALTTGAVGMGRRNTTRIRQLVSALAGKADQSALTSGLATKADMHALDARIPAGGYPGQLLMATPTGGRWSWADRHPTQYHDSY